MILPALGLKPTIYAAVGIAFAVFSWKAYNLGVAHGSNSVQTVFDQYVLQQQEALIEVKVLAETRERGLVDTIHRIKKEADFEKQDLVSEYELVIDELRSRPSARASTDSDGVSETPSSDLGCTGAGLAQPDAAFLAGYARDAATLRIALDQCVSAYEKVIQSLVKPHLK